MLYKYVCCYAAPISVMVLCRSVWAFVYGTKAYERCKEISSRKDKLFKYFQDHDMNGER
jgi:hypothetical protein